METTLPSKPKDTGTHQPLSPPTDRPPTRCHQPNSLMVKACMAAAHPSRDQDERLPALCPHHNAGKLRLAGH